MPKVHPPPLSAALAAELTSLDFMRYRVTDTFNLGRLVQKVLEDEDRYGGFPFALSAIAAETRTDTDYLYRLRHAVLATTVEEVLDNLDIPMLTWPVINKFPRKYRKTALFLVRCGLKEDKLYKLADDPAKLRDALAKMKIRKPPRV